jgi:hypothetical protein
VLFRSGSRTIHNLNADLPVSRSLLEDVLQSHLNFALIVR